MKPRSRTRAAALAAALLMVAAGLPACGSANAATVPSCSPGRRLGLVAQSVPTAAYVPCLRSLPEGWHTTAFDARDGRTRFSLLSDRADERASTVELRSSCDIDGASPTTPRADGARTYLRVRSIDPRYTGTLYDVFPGGCVTYGFDFRRGPHIGLMEDLQSAVGLYSRQQLRAELHRDLGIDLNP